MLRLPAPLRPGDTVRVIAPGGAFERDRLAAGLALLKGAGLVPMLTEAVYARDRYFAGPHEARQADLLAALADPSARAIWAARGGYGAARLLPRVSPEVVRQADKWLVGFSDVTALHALWARAGVGSLHGANVINLASWAAEARDELFEALRAPRLRTFAGTPLLGRGTARGWLTGGNLTVLASMAGTGMLPSWAGAVVLLEDVSEKPYRLDRCLNQLIQAGAFAGVAGVGLGQLTDCEDPNVDYTALEVLASALAPLGVPVVAGLSLGHEVSSRAVTFGVEATLQLADGTLHVGP